MPSRGSREGVRSLQNLMRAASTSRLINFLKLNSIRKIDDESDEDRQLFFKNKRLEQSFILKHNLRSDEPDAINNRSNVTKIIIPFDTSNLKSGGHYVFVGARGWEDALISSVGKSGLELDLPLIRHLDSLPSFDPFLLRGWLERIGRAPSLHYFPIGPAEIEEIQVYSFREMSSLVTLAMGETASRDAVGVLVRKMMDVRCSQELASFRETLHVEDEKFEECMFCWRGFLYYKFKLKKTVIDLPRVLREMQQSTAAVAAQNKDNQALQTMRVTISKKLVSSCRDAEMALAEYDKAFASLTRGGNPADFTNFLLQAPAKFVDLGLAFGSVMHVIQYWDFNTGAARRGPLKYDDLKSLFGDFAESLGLF